MQFDPNNKIIQLCIQGMDMEGNGKPEEAKELFLQAWQEATNDFEKFTSAHYVARHQKTVAQKLEWDIVALTFALKMEDKGMKGHFPSLYLNIAKCYEDLNNMDDAGKNYQLALSYSDFLPNDGYGQMIKSGIHSGIKRISKT